MAFTKSQVREVQQLVTYQVSGSTGKNLALIQIEGTTTANSDTYDISGDLPKVSGIEGPFLETYDEAVAATSSTWSGTTVTFAGHTGSGRYRGVFLVEVE